MLWNWAILRCSIIEDVDICWTETLLRKLQFSTFYTIHCLWPGHLLDLNPSNKVAVFNFLYRTWFRAWTFSGPKPF